MKFSFIIFLFVFPAKIFAQNNNEQKSEPVSPCVSVVFVPNSFRGNGDSVNDYFIPRLVGTPETYKFTIYNRWGEVVFETEKVEEGWTGYYKDKKLSDGTYYWVVSFTCTGSKEEYSNTGYVQLIN